jgi:hypothetical protein
MALTRIPPNLPAHAYRTFQMRAPLQTHFRPATCEETGCPQWTHGWRTVVDLSTVLGQSQAAYIRTRSEVEPGVFQFPAGQPCFRSDDHRTRNDRPELYVIRNGDHRVPDRVADPQVLSPDSWVDAFRTHTERLAAQA